MGFEHFDFGCHSLPPSHPVQAPGHESHHHAERQKQSPASDMKSIRQHRLARQNHQSSQGALCQDKERQ